MKKTLSFFVFLVMLLMIPGISSSAVEGPYISGNLGMAYLSENDVAVGGRDSIIIDYEKGFTGSFAAGYNYGTIRIEAEIGYQGNNADYKYLDYDDTNYYYDDDPVNVNYGKSNMKAYSFMGNFYLDFFNSSPVTPFLTAGIGIADVELFSTRDTVMAYQIGAGLAFDINPHMSIDLKYRYFATDDLDYNGYRVEFASHNVYAGFRYTF